MRLQPLHSDQVSYECQSFQENIAFYHQAKSKLGISLALVNVLLPVQLVSAQFDTFSAFLMNLSYTLGQDSSI